MNTIVFLLECIMVGIAFGFLLEKSKVFEPSVIVQQMFLKDFTMIKVFMSAIASGMIVFAILIQYDLVILQPITHSYFSSIVGGLTLGMGVAIAGACPGTIMAQIGAGYKDARFVAFGAVCGGIAFQFITKYINYTNFSNPTYATLDQAVNVPYWILALTISTIIFVLFFILNKKKII